MLKTPLLHPKDSPSSSTSSTISARDFSETLSPIMRRMVETVSTVMNPEFSVSKESKALRRAAKVKDIIQKFAYTLEIQGGSQKK